MFQNGAPRQPTNVRRPASIGRQLTHCPSCESDLIQIESLHALASEGTLVERRCPDCGHGDEIELKTALAEELCHHAAELAAGLHQLADRLEATDELLYPASR
jgi:peptide subunit release factor 1 (eRF1)